MLFKEALLFFFLMLQTFHHISERSNWLNFSFFPDHITGFVIDLQLGFAARTDYL
jgi:hypothetical protein